MINYNGLIVVSVEKVNKKIISQHINQMVKYR